jgi:hypothetical protein
VASGYGLDPQKEERESRNLRTCCFPNRKPRKTFVRQGWTCKPGGFPLGSGQDVLDQLKPRGKLARGRMLQLKGETFLQERSDQHDYLTFGAG